jgi:glutaredoxin
MKVTIVYTMNGCPWCMMMKEQLGKEGVPYLERDIDEHVEEYNEFVQITKNEFVPALMLISLDDENEPFNVKLLAPEKDFENIEDGVRMAKEYCL